MVLIAASLFTFASCNLNSYKPDAKVQQDFKAKYPQAAQPKWEQEKGYHVAEDGKLIKSVASNKDAQLPVTPEIQSLVAQKYPNATIINIDDESGFTEIDIIDGDVQKEILADSQNNWVSTSWNIWPNDVVAIVMDALKNSPYASYQIDEIDFIETPASSYYLFDLEQGENDLQIMIDLNGNITGK